MKVTLGKNYKKVFTLESLEQAKSLIRHLKEDETTPAEYLEIAARDLLRDEKDCVDYVISAEAETCYNYRVLNLYENTGIVDVWIHGIIKCYDQIIEMACYLSDIWSIDGENTNVATNCFVVRYKRQ